MKIQRLVQRANDIAAFFQSEMNRTQAVASIADHLHRFWDTRHCQQLRDHVRTTQDTGLCDLAEKAVRRLAKLK